jgi:hypothetical protein
MILAKSNTKKRAKKIREQGAPCSRNSEEEMFIEMVKSATLIN